MIGRRFRRTRHGTFQVRLDKEERDVLRGLPGQLRELLGSDDPSLWRLFPPAYLDDEQQQEEYRRLMGDDLDRRRRTALDVMEATVDADQLDEDQLSAWLSALNDLRLVLGTRLDVAEDMDEAAFDPADPRSPGFALYGYLTFLQDQVVQALSGALPRS